MHGITVKEAATNVVATKQVDSAIPCVIGTAPVHMGTERGTGKPVIAYSYEEAVEKLGYSDDWKSYTLCEAMYVRCISGGIHQRAGCEKAQGKGSGRHIGPYGFPKADCQGFGHSA